MLSIMEYTPPLHYLVRQSFKRFISYSLLLACLLILVRFYEILFISQRAGYPAGSTLELLYGIRFDLLLAFRVSGYLLIPFLFLDHYRVEWARKIFTAAAVLVVIGEVVLLRYFSTTRIPLGADIFGYSFSEMRQTVGASGEVRFSALLPILLFCLIGVFVYRRWPYFKVSTLGIFLATFLMLYATFSSNNLNPDPADYKTEFSMNIAANKLNLFGGSLFNYYRQKNGTSKFELNSSSAQNDLASDAVRSSAPEEKLLLPAGKNANGPVSDPSAASPAVSTVSPGNPFNYVSSDYPFLHAETTPDLLAPFFKPDAQAPNVVFIIVESLGRAYSGKDAYLGSFTPFLDSLMTKSLYWENCLSTSGRTFSVIPSLTASLPFGEKGFADLGDKMPDHLSLISLLRNSANYSSSFYYGGDPKFDNMESFLNHQGGGKIVGIRDFGPDYKQLPADQKGYSWGYGDRDLFRKDLTDLKANEKERRVDLMLTLAMHNPFMVPDQAHYNDLVEKRMVTDKLSDEQKKYNRQYLPQFASILYFDDALRYFFQEFSKLKSFEHTIFVITGDHRMPEIPISTQLDRFHIPLVIYSPLLKQGVKFSSIVTHYDVTPSLLALFKNRMNLVLPTLSAWIGHGLDTQVAFRNLSSYPLKRNTGELTDFLSGTHFLSGTTLYKIYPDLNIEPENNPELNDQLQKQFSNYKAKNNFATRGNQVIPDSLKKYIRK